MRAHGDSVRARSRARVAGEGLGNRWVGLQIGDDVAAHLRGVLWLKRRKPLLIVGAQQRLVLGWRPRISAIAAKPARVESTSFAIALNASSPTSPRRISIKRIGDGRPNAVLGAIASSTPNPATSSPTNSSSTTPILATGPETSTASARARASASSLASRIQSWAFDAGPLRC